MRSRPWMPLYVADYLADTAHLNAAESGAYLHLIMHYWLNEGLPQDDRLLARITKLSQTQWRAVRPVIREFFSDEWKHKRIEFELTQTARISAAGRAGGKASGDARRRAKEQRSTNDRSTNCEALHSPSQLQPQEQKERLSSLRSDLSDWENDFREIFWSKYPKKVDKGGALRKLESIKKSGKVAFSVLMAAVERYADADIEQQYIKSPQVWLNKGCWDDDPAAFGNSNRTHAPPRTGNGFLELALNYERKSNEQHHEHTIEHDPYEKPRD